VVYLPNRRDRYYRHLDLLPLVTQAEYSCRSLHNSGAWFPRRPLLGSSVNRGRPPPLAIGTSGAQALGLEAVDCQGMDRDPKRVFVSLLEAFEGIAYLTIAFGLSVPIVMLVVSAVMSMLEVAEVGALETALAVLNSLLLAFIFVELIDTIRIVATMNERGIFVAEPFLLVGVVAVMRSILLLIANLKQVKDPGEAQTLLFELVGLTLLVIVLTGALYFTRRIRLSEKEGETSE
jgi:Phosphate-starvation-inducible E family